jgi:competence protein ComEC
MKRIILVVTLLLFLDFGALVYVRSTKDFEQKSVAQKNFQASLNKPSVIEKIFGKKSKNENEIVIHFLDIGQGDASYVEFPNGEDMLVDCSLDARILSSLGKVMSTGDRTIDYLIVTHPHADHYGGCIDVMKRFAIRHIYYNGLERKNDTAWEYFWDTTQQEIADGSSYTQVKNEQTFSIASSSIHFLYPDHDISKDKMDTDTGDSGHDVNDTSIVFTLQYGRIKALFTGDMESTLEPYIIKKYGKELDSDILKVGHHGSATASSVALLNIVSPAISSISVGKGNTYHLPSLRIIRRLQRLGGQVWRTDETGSVTIVSDGEHAVVDVGN